MNQPVRASSNPPAPITARPSAKSEAESIANSAESHSSHDKVVMMFAHEYDISCKEQLRVDLEPLTNVRSIVLDFTDVTYLDSTVIGELIRLHKIRTSKGYGRETIVANNPRLGKLFNMVSFHEIFNVVASLADIVEKPGELIDLQYAQSGLNAHQTSPRHMPSGRNGTSRSG